MLGFTIVDAVGIKLLVLAKLLREPVRSDKSRNKKGHACGLMVPHLFREEPEHNLKAGAHSVFEEICSSEDSSSEEAVSDIYNRLMARKNIGISYFCFKN